MLTAPFPYNGGKRRWANIILDRFGGNRQAVYVEPFIGSAAVLLANPRPYQREIVCDTDGHVANFWRAIRADPDAVAYYADWPTIHDDLTARHTWLIRWGAENAGQVRADADWYDAKAAGWWCWGMSQWIGGGFAQEGQIRGPGAIPQAHHERGVQAHRPGSRPHIKSHNGGMGVQVQRETDGKRPHIDPKPNAGTGVQVQRQQIPAVDHKNGGTGVSAQRSKTPRPHISHGNWEMSGGQGVQVQRNTIPTGQPCSGERLLPWFYALAQRLERVVVLSRDFQSALTPTLLQQTTTGPKPPVCVFLDPPYRTTTGRKDNLYGSDLDGSSEDAAIRAYEWAVENGGRPGFKVAYAMYEGDFALPDGWDIEHLSMAGYGGGKERRDCVIFSPAARVQGRLI